MRLVVILLAMTALTAAQPPAAAPPQDGPDEPEATFRRAVLEEPEAKERVAALKQIVKEHPDSAWADDALWLLGEAARKEERWDGVVRYWHVLMAGKRKAELEDLTKSLPVYKASGLPQVSFYVARMGLKYVYKGGVRVKSRQGGRLFYDVEPFNPLPMAVWAGLGRAYDALEKPSLSLKSYRKAAKSAPSAGPWRRRYEERVRDLESRLPATPDATGKDHGEAEEADGPAQDEARAPSEGPADAQARHDDGAGQDD